MGRPLRIQFPGAIYYAMARGNGRQKIFRDDRNYQSLLDGLEAIVDKLGFEILRFVCMLYLHLANGWSPLAWGTRTAFAICLVVQKQQPFNNQ